MTAVHGDGALELVRLAARIVLAEDSVCHPLPFTLLTLLSSSD